ncbi:MAG: 1,4-dihydroxy-2-naphthoate polyprenyltransferase [Bacteroidetes bacterium]|nr:1,4-dihydroxy-2-naphthoate polyprenyltransferase [Bacteroidota bacterium]
MLKHWIKAFRLRTLPLALSCIVLGSALAKSEDHFNTSVFILAISTTIFLQILSNLSNDYGDSVHGADNAERVGPARAVQSGAITAQQMKKAMIVFIVLSLFSGIALVYEGTKDIDLSYGLLFILLGIAAITAAIKYTAGKNPYGYRGFGDLFVFIFFGIVGVIGTYYLHHHELKSTLLLPAAAVGFLSAAVLNLNNMRDRIPDEKAGKRTLVVHLGKEKAKYYHLFLLSAANICALTFVFSKYENPKQFLFLLVIPVHLLNLKKVFSYNDPASLDPELKKIALSTLLFSILLGAGNI